MTTPVKKINFWLEQLMDTAKYMVAIGLFIVIMVIATGSKDVSKTNQGYLVAQACVSSVPVDQRTDQFYKDCYSHAEDIIGIKLERFGRAKE